MPYFEVLEAKIWLQHWTESCIIPNSIERSLWRQWKLKKKIAFCEEERSLTWPLRVLRGHWSQWLWREICWLFSVVLWNDDIQEFDSKWDEILLSMTQIPSHDILEGLYKLKIRESEKFKTVLSLYTMEIQQVSWPWSSQIERLWWKEVSSRKPERINFEARNGNYERSAVVKNK